jgi:hypothetical protein
MVGPSEALCCGVPVPGSGAGSRMRDLVSDLLHPPGASQPARPHGLTCPPGGYNVSMAAGIVAAIVTAVIVVVVLAGFVWAAREDGRAQRRQDRLSGRRR